MIWDKLIEIQNLIEDNLDKTGKEIAEPGMDRFNQPDWVRS